MPQQISLFQGSLAIGNNGEIADQEGLVISTQTMVGIGGGQSVAGNPFTAREGYFFEFWFNSFVEPGGTTMFCRAFPPGTNPSAFGLFIGGALDGGMGLNNLTQPSKIIIPPGWLIAPVWFNGGVGTKAQNVIVGLHLKDCPANNRSAIL